MSEKIKVWSFEIPSFDSIVRFQYYDQGSDMDITKNYRVTITNNGIEVKELRKEVEGLNVWELYRNYDRLKEEVFVITSKVMECIEKLKCPRCGKRLKKIGGEVRKRFSEYGAFLSTRYPDVKPREEESNKTYTCNCGLTINLHFDTWDGGAVLNWRHEFIDQGGNKVELEKVGFYNEYRHFWENIHFIDGLIKLQGAGA
jgi:hypothetical protein